MAGTIAHIVLAAGASRRLGEPKQLVEFEGEALIRRVARIASADEGGPVLVVLGAEAERCQAALAGLGPRVATLVVPEWGDGMGASLAAGVRHLLTRAEPAVIGVLLCDQYRVESVHLKALREKLGATEKSIVAARAGEWLGPPAYFRPRWYPHLTRLEGERGARSLVARHPEDTEIVELPEIADDLDEATDLLRLRAEESRRRCGKL